MADKASDKDDKKAKAAADEPDTMPGGLPTTDPSFEDGAQEVDSKPWNPPTE